ncbi:hypothetical protein BGZ65_009097 [Modicella reniformis]|uniref:BZIP domain-containing protein n=1 Tax=Modicella reniformis TaxID=1440133 RepID=A0A9P6J6R1_9FUNG|nr:hypothetical protein BGZ65_009097 [Modicella reniformis]
MIDFTMFDLNDPKLSKAADSLESALAQLSKNATSFIVPNNGGNANNLLVSSSSPDSGTAMSNIGAGFDEWLANDFNFGVLPGDDTVSSSLTSSPYSVLNDSPELGFESLHALISGPSLFDMNLGGYSGNDLISASVVSSPVISSVETNKGFPPSLSSSAIQQAAAALNIPWSHALEKAVIAQAQAQAQSTAISGSILPINGTPAIIIPKMEHSEQSIVVPSSPILLSDASIEALSMTPQGSPKKRALTPEDEPDEIVLKRAKNTDAARRSRMKKLLRLETLETKVTELESTNNRLTMKVAILETEKNGHLVKETEQNARIAQLEAKLAEAHAALTSRA